MAPRASILVVLGFGAFLPNAAAASDAPSRPAIKGCAWEKLSDAGLGFEAWVQRCDFGFRKIDLRMKERTLVARYSDGGDPVPLVEVLDLLPGEAQAAGIRRLFDARTKKGLQSLCVIAPYLPGKAPPGVERFTFLPNVVYRKELDKKIETGVPDPPCGDWGDSTDGIQYFEAHPASRSQKVLFVRVGQDEPLFDEATLQLLPPRSERP